MVYTFQNGQTLLPDVVYPIMHVILVWVSQIVEIIFCSTATTKQFVPRATASTNITDAVEKLQPFLAFHLPGCWPTIVVTVKIYWPFKI